MHVEQDPEAPEPPRWTDLDKLARQAGELRSAVADLDDRESKARSGGASAAELAGFADERDGLAAQWDDLAAEHDTRATRRDGRSLSRDVRASERDVRSREADDDRDPGFADRFLSAVDRDRAAGDRADAYDDRARSAGDRHRAAEQREQSARDRAEGHERERSLGHELSTLRAGMATRSIIGQAQGLLMARYRVDAEGAFAMLVRLSQETHTKLREVAARLVEPAIRDHDH